MIRWAVLLATGTLAAFVAVTLQSPPPAPAQPIGYSHKQHMDHFAEGRHRQAMLALHETFLGEMVYEMDEMRCEMCHGSFEEAARETPRIQYCAWCHGTFLGHDFAGREAQKPCIGCHHGVVDSPRASIPNIDTCRACHVPPVTGSADEARALAYIEGGETIPWNRVYEYIPGDIVFSHERHVEIGRVACQECHGDVRGTEGPISRDVKLSMEDCIRCHERLAANNDCLACHK